MQGTSRSLRGSYGAWSGTSMIDRLFEVSRDYLRFAATVMALSAFAFVVVSAVHAWPLTSIVTLGILVAIVILLSARQEMVLHIVILGVVSITIAGLMPSSRRR